MFIYVGISHPSDEKRKATAKVEIAASSVLSFSTEERNRKGNWARKDFESGDDFDKEMERLGFGTDEARIQIEEAIERHLEK